MAFYMSVALEDKFPFRRKVFDRPGYTASCAYSRAFSKRSKTRTRTSVQYTDYNVTYLLGHINDIIRYVKRTRNM